MSDDAKILRALYLKGLMPGKQATIELTAPISGRNAEDEYVHLAEKGDRLIATMQRDSWLVVISEDEDGTPGRTATIPLANGKVR